MQLPEGCKRLTTKSQINKQTYYMSLSHLKDVNKTYQGAQPLHVLKGIDLDIERGEFVSVMCAAGS